MTGPKALSQYQQVRAKVTGGLSVAAAVKAVSEETGASRGTLQSVYYRVARETGATAAKPRATARRKAASSAKRHRRTRPTTRTTAGTTSSTVDLLRQLADTATALSTRIAELERDAAKLREIEAAFARGA